MTEPTWEDVHVALKEKGYEVVKGTSTDKQYRTSGRVPEGKLVEWKAVRKALYYVTLTEGKWTIDISRHYFPADTTCRKELYEWRIILQGSDLNAAIPHLLSAVRSAKPELVVGGPVMVMEVPLLAGPSRNDPSRRRGRGAQSALTAIVGPDWKNRMNP